MSFKGCCALARLLSRKHCTKFYSVQHIFPYYLTFTHLKDYYLVLAETETYEMGTYAGESEVNTMFSGEQCDKYMKTLETYLAF